MRKKETLFATPFGVSLAMAVIVVALGCQGAPPNPEPTSAPPAGNESESTPEDLVPTRITFEVDDSATPPCFEDDANYPINLESGDKIQFHNKTRSAMLVTLDVAELDADGADFGGFHQFKVRNNGNAKLKAAAVNAETTIIPEFELESGIPACPRDKTGPKIIIKP